MSKRLIGLSLGLGAILWIMWSVRPEPDPQLVELERHRQIWRRAGMTRYQFKLGVVCYCSLAAGSPVVVTVDRGAMTSIKPIRNRSQQFSAAEFQRVSSVDRLFQVVEDTLQRPAVKVEVTYDEAKGYPRRVSIDPNIPDAGVVYSVEELRGLR